MEEQALNFTNKSDECPFGSTTKWELITPTYAADVLKLHNNCNRKRVSQKHIDEITLNMNRGTFNAEAGIIQFRFDGELLNGQHRFQALLKYGKPMWFNVQRGCKGDTMMFIDHSVKARAYSDTLDIRGEKYSHNLPNVINTYLCLSLKMEAIGGGSKLKSHFTDGDRDIILDKKREIIFTALQMFNHTKGTYIKNTTMAGYAFFLMDVKHYKADKIKEFFYKLDGWDMSIPAINLLRKRLGESNDSKLRKLTGEVKTNLINKTWNYYVLGVTPKQLKWDTKRDKHVEIIPNMQI